MGMDERLSLCPLRRINGSLCRPVPALRLQAGELTRSYRGALLPNLTVAAGIQGPSVELRLCIHWEGQMTSSYSARSRAIEPFHVMALLARANELQALGRDVIHLEIGEPDFTTAAPIVAAGQAALNAGHTRYTAGRR